MAENQAFNSVAIALTTHYPHWYKGKVRSIRHTDKIRGDLALETIYEAVSKGCFVTISDGLSSKFFRRELAKISGVIVNKRKVKKRSPGKRMAIRTASKIPGVKVIIVSEPEKVSLITDCLEKMVSPILSDEAEIVIPQRVDELFLKSYPKSQYDSETEGNHIYNEALRAYGMLGQDEKDLDMFFGPRVFANKKHVVNLFMRKYKFNLLNINIELPAEFFDLEQLSNALFFPIVVALKKNIKIKSVEVPFVYPKIQKHNEETGSREFFLEKRRAQRLSLVIEMLHFISYLEKKRTSRIRRVRQ